MVAIPVGRLRGDRAGAVLYGPQAVRRVPYWNGIVRFVFVIAVVSLDLASDLGPFIVALVVGDLILGLGCVVVLPRVVGRSHRSLLWNAARLNAMSDIRQHRGPESARVNDMHTAPGLKVLYFGTPVVLITSMNEDGRANIAPMSSAWWLGQSCMLGLSDNAHTTANLHRDRECVLNLPASSMVDAVDRIALTTGRKDVPEYRRRIGYRYEGDKFALGGLTRQASELVRAPRILECPIQLECRVTTSHAFGDGATAFHVEVLRAHVEESLLVPGTHYVDPLKWDPLIMKFCEFFGGGENVHPSRLAEGWRMPQLVSP